MFLNTDKNVLSINEIISRECLCGMQLKLQYRQILVSLSIPRRVPWGNGQHSKFVSVPSCSQWNQWWLECRILFVHQNCIKQKWRSLDSYNNWTLSLQGKPWLEKNSKGVHRYWDKTDQHVLHSLHHVPPHIPISYNAQNALTQSFVCALWTEPRIRVN